MIESEIMLHSKQVTPNTGVCTLNLRVYGIPEISEAQFMSEVVPSWKIYEKGEFRLQ